MRYKCKPRFVFYTHFLLARKLFIVTYLLKVPLRNFLLTYIEETARLLEHYLVSDNKTLDFDTPTYDNRNDAVKAYITIAIRLRYEYDMTTTKN